jgi:dienelactone hydrolase
VTGHILKKALIYFQNSNRLIPFSAWRLLPFFLLILTQLTILGCVEHEGMPTTEKKHKIRPKVDQLRIEREPRWTYGNMEAGIRGIRDSRPVDLNSEFWHETYPERDYEEWQKKARKCLRTGLHYDPGKLDLRATVLKHEETDDITRELVEFNTTPWFRVKGYFLRPKNAQKPLPGLVVFHAWGGPMLFGKERIVNTGRDHPLLDKLRKKLYDGRYLAEELAKRGYAVITIDNYHFGERTPRGIHGIPDILDPFTLSETEYHDMDKKIRNRINLGLQHLNWAGTTWAGVNFGDDSRCIDYLLSRPEVDPDRIGCTGLSGGGWRTNILAALDTRIKAAVSVGWMTSGDYQQVYNIAGACGAMTMLPGVWDRLDIPDLIAMAAPCASMVVVGTEDHLFPPEGVQEANRQIQEAYEWAGIPQNFNSFNPPKAHCYDLEIQQESIAWFDRHLKY